MKKKLLTLLMAVAVAATIIPCEVEAASTKTVYLLDSYTYVDTANDEKGDGKLCNKVVEKGTDREGKSYTDTVKYTYDKKGRATEIKYGSLAKTTDIKYNSKGYVTA